MNIFHAAPSPSTLPYGSISDGHEWSPLLTTTPPFRVDALVVHPDLADSEQVVTLKKYGRPVLIAEDVVSPSDLEELAAATSRTNYVPINCSFYDHFEISIMRGTQVPLEVKGAKGEVAKLEVRLLDTKTDRTEEFVQLADQRWIRLDDIVSVGGAVGGGGCRV